MNGGLHRYGLRRAGFLLSACLGVFLTAAPALSQPNQTQINAVRQNCRSDYMAHCSSVPPSGAELAELPAEQFGAAFGLLPKCGRRTQAGCGGPGRKACGSSTASRASGCPRAGTHRCTGARSGGDSGRPGPTTTTPYTDCETTSQPSGAAAADGGCPGRSACRSTARTCMGVRADAAAAAARTIGDRPRVRWRPAGGVQHGAARRRTRDRVPGAQRADTHAVLPANAGQRQGVGGALAR